MMEVRIHLDLSFFIDIVKHSHVVKSITENFVKDCGRLLNKRAMMALYRSTGWYVKSIHTKHYITWELA